MPSHLFDHALKPFHIPDDMATGFPLDQTERLQLLALTRDRLPMGSDTTCDLGVGQAHVGEGRVGEGG